jgi:hypothetical protein
MRNAMQNRILKRIVLSFFILFPAVGWATVQDYGGTAYPDGIPHSVPGSIEAEDFDNGGESIAYHDTDNANRGDSNYRPEAGVDIEARNLASNHNSIGWSEESEWTKYTINVLESGTYRIETYCVSGVDNGKFHLEIDEIPVCRVLRSPSHSDWGNFTKAAIAENVQLTAGIHVFTWYSYGSINVDKFTFVRTGEWTGEVSVGNFNYPIEKKMTNPLFIDFDSPMWNSPGIGALYAADPSAHVWADGRLYVYASHDMEPPAACDRMDRYHVFSTDDMENWTDHGEILNSSQVSWGLPAGGLMWAPDCAYNPQNQTYYLYFPHISGSQWGSDWKIGVATSKDPTQNFVVQGFIEGLEPLIDPCVFVDDDGQPYIYHGGGGACMAGKLDINDWTKLDGSMQKMMGLADFHEATWVHKYNGKYYLSYADNHGADGNQMRYAISDSPLGPWNEKGAYLYATGTGTDHGSIVEYKRKWYAFYHTSNYSGHDFLRSVCVDSLEYNEDGSIRMVQNYGTPYQGIVRTVIKTDHPSDIALELEAEDFNDGGEHSAYHDKNSNIGNNTTYRPNEKVDLYTNNGTTYVGDFIKGEWIRYTITVEETALYDIDCLVSANENGSRFHVSMNGTNLSGKLTIPVNAAFSSVKAKNILINAGENYVDIRADEGNFNVDKLIFRISESYQGTSYKNHSVPGTIDAEDFDNGGQGVAYFDNTPTSNDGGYNYRNNGDGIGVDLENSSGSIHISHTDNGEWTKYTFEVTQAGIYNISLPVSTGNNSPGSLYLTFEDIDVYPMVNINTGGWGTYKPLTVENVSLTKGQHVMTLNIGGNINVDKFVFERKSALSLHKIASGNVYLYPNPTEGLFAIHKPGEGDVRINDLNGRILYHNHLCSTSDFIDISTYPVGIYLVTVATNNEQQQLKLIKK